VAADDNDDPGVLGNLPRSRPGHRSAKRSTGAGARKPPAQSGAKGGTRARATAGTQKAKRPAAAKPAASTSSKPKTTARPRPAQQPAAQAPQQSGSGDPLSQAVRLAGKVAETGVKTAVGIIRRLPGGR
jgi:hypothetical protein